MTRNLAELKPTASRDAAHLNRPRPMRIPRLQAACKSQNGSALLFVLIMGTLLTSLTLVAMRGTSTAMRAAAVFADEVRVEELGRSGIDLALANIGRLAPQERLSGSFAFGLKTGHIAVAFVSETARADVNRASPALLAVLLSGIGLDPDVAQHLSAEIGDWRDPQASKRAEATKDEDYLSRNRPAPGQRPFFDPVEVAQVLDMTPEILARLLPLLTVCSGQEKIDPLVADRTMLRVLFGDDARARAYLDLRSHGKMRRDEALAPFPDAVRGFLEPDARAAPGLRLRIAARAGTLERRFDVSICPDDGAGLRLMAWHAV